MRALITGVAGFIASHLADALVQRGSDVTGLDNLRSGKLANVHSSVHFVNGDIGELGKEIAVDEDWFDVLFHCAAIARTPWTIEDPILTSLTNAHGTAVVLEAARKSRIKRVVLCSSNVVYAAQTPYRVSKEMTEMWGRCYRETYGMSVISLRFSNVYGTRQSEEGPSPNVFAALRKKKRDKGFIEITGDGTQSRDFTAVHDIVKGLILAGDSDLQYDGLDLCTGTNWTLNEVAKMFGCSPETSTVRYIPPRSGDVLHIAQDPKPAKRLLNWESTIPLPEGIKECL